MDPERVRLRIFAVPEGSWSRFSARPVRSRPRSGETAADIKARMKDCQVSHLIYVLNIKPLPVNSYLLYQIYFY